VKQTRIKVTAPILAKSEGGKKVGLGCQARIDQAAGCINGCKGCYARRVLRAGSRFDTVSERKFDEVALRKSIKRIKKQGIDVCRCGTVCDPAYNMETLFRIIRIATDESLTLIVATKALAYRKDIAEALVDGGHFLQVSLGMLSKAQSDEDRVKVTMLYKMDGVKTMYRITTDMTLPPSKFYISVMRDSIPVLLTPLRVIEGADICAYNLDLDNYEFEKGYYRPLFIYPGWNAPVCGEVTGEIRCANCLVPCFKG